MKDRGREIEIEIDTHIDGENERIIKQVSKYVCECVRV